MYVLNVFNSCVSNILFVMMDSFYDSYVNMLGDKICGKRFLF